MSESRFIFAYIMFDFWQRIYTYQLFSLPELIPTKDISPVTLQIRNRNTESEDQLELDIIWANNQHVITYSQHITCQVFVRFNINLTKKIKLILTISYSVFLRDLIIENKNKAILEVKE